MITTALVDGVNLAGDVEGLRSKLEILRDLGISTVGIKMNLAYVPRQVSHKDHLGFQRFVVTVGRGPNSFGSPPEVIHEARKHGLTKLVMLHSSDNEALEHVGSLCAHLKETEILMSPNECVLHRDNPRSARRKFATPAILRSQLIPAYNARLIQSYRDTALAALFLRYWEHEDDELIMSSLTQYFKWVVYPVAPALREERMEEDISLFKYREGLLQKIVPLGTVDEIATMAKASR